ncbi:MAG: ABC transporter substrate-binding protein, partial [Clostridia bacterium]
MNKKIFKVLALVLVVVIGIVAMAACGQQAPTKDNTKFVIGGSGPLTGGAAVYGIAVKNAAQLAVDEINAAGGLNGVNFELNFKDDMAEADKATAAYSILYDAGMNVSMGSVTTGSCIAFAKQAAKDNV